MKKRIVIAVIAVAVIHISFYAVPRWWYTRAMVYPQAYEKAVAILKEEFGEKAVEKGIVSIPKEAISLPYEGQACISGGDERLIIDLRPGRESYVFGVSADSTATVARTSFGRARELWAIVYYLRWAHGRFEKNILLELGPDHHEFGKGAFIGRTWLARRVTTTEPPLMRVTDKGVDVFFGEPGPPTPDNGIHEAAWTRVIDQLRATGELSTPCGPDDSQKAMKRTIEACFPCADERDVEIVNSLLGTYAQNARRADLKLLKRIEAGGEPLPAWLIKVPVIGRRIADWNEMRRMYQIPRGSSAPVWAATHLAGMNDQEQFKALVAVALQKPGATFDDRAMVAARRILNSTRRREWKKYLADHYQSLSVDIDSMFLAFGDDRLTRLVADDNRSERQPLAWAALYAITKDRRYISRLEETALNAGPLETRKIEAALWVLPSLSRSDPACDFPKVARAMLARLTSASAGRGADVVYALERAEIPSCDALLIEVATAPSGVLSGEFIASRQGQLLCDQAAYSLTRRANADIARVLVPYVAQGCREGEAKIWQSAVDILGRAGDDAATQLLETMAASGAYGVASPDEPRPAYAVKRALALRQMAKAPQPVAAYLALDHDARWSLSARDLAQMTAEQLKELLAADAAAEERVRILSGLLWKRKMGGP